MAIVAYTPENADRLISTGTDPWVEVNGQVVTWKPGTIKIFVNSRCENLCYRGVLIDADRVGIERCDACAVYDGDLEAAQVLADTVGGVVMFETPSGVTCPVGTTQPDGSPHTIVGCGSTDVAGPDSEGIYDCLNCGMFFKPEQEPVS